MSTSLIYHAFQARTYHHVKTVFEGGVVYFHLTKKPHLRRCVECRSKRVTLEGRRDVTLRSLPIGSKPTCLARKDETPPLVVPRLEQLDALLEANDTEFFQLRVLFIHEVGTKVTGV